jgi:tetratricopeptide (TPR) repeat protein
VASTIWITPAQRPDEALEYLRLSEVHARAFDTSPLLPEILGVRGYAALAAGDVHTATGLLEEAVARFHAQVEEDGAAWAAINLGLARFREGTYDVALEVLRESCLVCDRLGVAPLIPAALLGVGAIRERLGDAESGAVLVAAANALARQMGVPWEEVEEAIAAETAEALRRDVAADRLAELTAAGEALTLEQALALVLAEHEEVG